MKENSRPKNAPEVQVADLQFLDSVGKPVFKIESPETFACGVCSAPGATHRSEGLCWVCQRLKISAWKESEQQMVFTE